MAVDVSIRGKITLLDHVHVQNALALPLPLLSLPPSLTANDSHSLKARAIVFSYCNVTPQQMRSKAILTAVNLIKMKQWIFNARIPTDTITVRFLTIHILQVAA